MLKKITCWFTVTDKGRSYNHYSEDHSESNIPPAKFPNQEKVWTGLKWHKEFNRLDTSVTPNKIITDGVLWQSQ